MTSIELLISEHRNIEIVLDALAKMVEEGMMMKKLRFLQAEEILDFITNYADRWHHGKEEVHLFAVMKDKKDKTTDDYIIDLNSEHDRGRACVKGMKTAFREAAHGDMAEVMNFAKNAREYLDILKGHIKKEDLIMFPYFAGLVTPGDEQRIQDLFKTVELNGVTDAAAVEKKYSEMAENLAFVFNIRREGDMK